MRWLAITLVVAAMTACQSKPPALPTPAPPPPAPTIVSHPSPVKHVLPDVLPTPPLPPDKPEAFGLPLRTSEQVLDAADAARDAANSYVLNEGSDPLKITELTVLVKHLNTDATQLAKNAVSGDYEGKWLIIVRTEVKEIYDFLNPHIKTPAESP